MQEREIDYKLNLEERAHKQLAKQYFGKSEISDEEYMKAKQTNFRGIINDEQYCIIHKSQHYKIFIRI